MSRSASTRAHPDAIERLVTDEWSRSDIERAVIREQQRLDATRADAERASREPDDEVRSSQRDGRTAQAQGSNHHDAERAAARERNHASKNRLDFTSSLLTRRIPKTDVWAHVSTQLLSDLSSTHAKYACRILGIEPIEGTGGPDHRGAVEAYAERTTADRDRAVLAAALAIGEEHARYRSSDPTATRHIEFLTAFGFDQSDAEDGDRD
jgi:hypothetical protein